MKKIPIWKNVALILSILVMLIIATFAWFFKGTKGGSEDIVVHVGEARYIQISGGSGNQWGEDLDIDLNINQYFKEMSGNGTAFYAPVYDVTQNADGGFSTVIKAFEKVESDEYYYEEIIDFRGDAVQNVYLSPESYVISVDSTGNSYIDGAIRVAFFELDQDGNETLKCIWAPNSRVQYSHEDNTFIREGSVEPYYCYQTSVNPVDPSTVGSSNSNIIKLYTTDTDEAFCGYDPTNHFMWSDGKNLPANAPAMLTVDIPGEEELFYKRMKVRIWLEGHDRECVSLLSGQRFTAKLQFHSQEGE